MNCPYCGSELEHHDSFGRFFSHQDGNKTGDIFICLSGRDNTGDCKYDGFFHTFINDDELHEGYPC